MKTSFLVLIIAILLRREWIALWQAFDDTDPCFNAYNSRLSIYNAQDLHPDFIPKLGMGHVTLAGVRHHGMKNFEVWLQNLAPGVATPIHRHPSGCEEINYVLSGSGIVRTLSADGGKVSEAAITVNSTMIAPPGTIWMVKNTGKVTDLKVLVVIGCHQPGIHFFDS